MAPWATHGHREVWAEPCVARCGEDVDGQGRWRSVLCSYAHLFFLPPPKVMPMRKPRNQFHVKMRSCKHLEPWLDSNLFVTLP